MVTVYIISKFTGRCAGCCKGETMDEAIGAAIIMMTTRVRNMDEARATFVLTKNRPALKTQWLPLKEPTMPFGKYEGCRIDTVPVEYLVGLVRDDTLELQNPPLVRAIKKSIGQRGWKIEEETDKPEALKSRTFPIGDLAFDDLTSGEEREYLAEFIPSTHNSRSTASSRISNKFDPIFTERRQFGEPVPNKARKNNVRFR